MVEEIINVEYQSQWTEGYCDSFAMLNLKTGEVFNIEDSEDGANYECHERDVIFTKDGTEVLVEDQSGFEYAICMEDIHLFINEAQEPATYLSKLEALGVGFEIRFIHSNEYSLFTKGGGVGQEVTVTSYNGMQLKGKRVVVKNKPHKNNGKWRAKRQSDDGSMSSWSNEYLGDTMEEALQSLYENEVVKFVETQEKYREAIDKKLTHIIL